MNRIYIIGAGFAGRTLAEEIESKGIFGTIIAFLDDDPTKIGSQILGVPVLGPIDRLLGILTLQSDDEAILAMPSARRERIRDIYLHLKRQGFSKIRILPDVNQFIEGDAYLVQTRELDVQDLLGRKPLKINLRESLGYLRGKRVLITGAGGSIGSELARQLLGGGASRIYLFGHGENSIYEIERELRILQKEGIGREAMLVPVLGELQDAEYVDFIMGRLKADIVFHSAAYKHVPMMEENPVNAIRNNVFGTWHLVNSAKRHGVKRFVLISTDKAVEPSSVYGASKKLAESIVIGQDQLNSPLFPAPERADFRGMVVRFGNVLGSRGSIIPLFKEQIRTGGPLTITHNEVNRFFITIPEAVSLVLKAGGVGEHRKLYILDMGEPILIRELAEQMIRFYGYEPEKDIPILVIGLRKGEKLHEILHEPWENLVTTGAEKILEVENSHAWAQDRLQEIIDALYPICFSSAGAGVGAGSSAASNSPASNKPASQQIPHPDPVYRNRRVLRAYLRELFPSLPEQIDEPEY